jgi:hypothetical protein
LAARLWGGGDHREARHGDWNMIELDEELRGRLLRAIDDRIPISAAYVDSRGRPHISFYGSTHPYGPDQLALWVRNPQGELPRSLAERPHMAFIYGSIADKVYITLEGRGRVVEDPTQRDQVFSGMHPIEQQFDAERKGVAVIVDLDVVTVLSAAAGRRVMHR